MSTNGPVNDGCFPMSSPPATYRARRQRLAAALDRPMVVFAGQAPARNYVTNPYPFRAQSTYLYFGGPPVEGAVLVIEPGSNGDDGVTLFRDPPGADDDVWVGPMPGDGDLAEAAGLGEGRITDSGDLARHLSGRNASTIPVPCHGTGQRVTQLALATANNEEREAIVAMRLIKDEHELAAMRRAAEVTVRAHRAAMGACRPGRTEADVAGVYHQVLVSSGCRPSFTPIATIRSEVLHCQVYPNAIHEDAMFLIDAGAEEPGGYAGDVTRTVPAAGRFTPVQRLIYDTVERAMQRGVEACTVGTRYRDIHFLTARIVCEGLIEAGLLSGDPATLAERGAHTLFYPHGVGHLIGLDAHDMEDYGDLAGYAPGRTRSTQFGTKYLRLDRDLEAGMCVTIEPGIYFIPGIWRRDALVAPLKDCVNVEAVEPFLRGAFGGVRLEQTVYVRAEADGGPEALSADLPVAADDILPLVGCDA